MKNKLISMVDMVLSHDNRHPTIAKDAMKYCGIFDYAIFLNTPLNISMFVPAIEVDGKWEVLDMPTTSTRFTNGLGKEIYSSLEQYQTAKYKVIFEGCVLVDSELWCNAQKIAKFAFGEWIFLESETIQDLIKYNPTLTPYGMELSGLNK